MSKIKYSQTNPHALLFPLPGFPVLRMLRSFQCQLLVRRLLPDLLCLGQYGTVSDCDGIKSDAK